MTRFRPVILTAITTALGLVPLAVGLNFDFFGLYRSLQPELFWGGDQAAWWGSMCISVIAGILFATLLTLVLVPVMYSVADDAEVWLRRHYLGEDDTTGAGAPSERAPRLAWPREDWRPVADPGAVVHAFEGVDPRIRPATDG